MTGDPLRYFASSPGVRRGYCMACGSSLSYQSEPWPNDIHLMLDAFDEPEGLCPQFHVFETHRLPWLRLADQLPRYRTTPSVDGVS